MPSTGTNPTVATSGILTPLLMLPSSNEVIASNDDLLIEILLRLPIKSLGKFKLVSKHWRSLISGSRFSSLRYPNPVSGFFLLTSAPNRLPKYKFHPFQRRPSTHSFLKFLSCIGYPLWLGLWILQSCNGFLLCRWSTISERYNGKYYICNPTTQQSTLLPEFIDNVYSTVVGIGMAFDPSKSLDYKVVCVMWYGFVSYRYHIEIYSSESRLWKQSQSVDLFIEPDDEFDYGIFWNGAIHWFYETIGSNLDIFCFDVNKDRVREMPMPEIPNGWNIIYFGESRKHLHLILRPDPAAVQFNVYEMKEDCSEWFEKYRVDLDTYATPFLEINYFLNPANSCPISIFCLVREENDEESFLVLGILNQTIVCYNLNDKTLKLLCGIRQGDVNNGWRAVHQYIESLVYVR